MCYGKNQISVLSLLKSYLAIGGGILDFTIYFLVILYARWFFTLASLCCIHKRLYRYVIIPIYFYMVVALSDCCSFCAMIKWTRKYFFWQTDAARNCEAGRCPLFLDFCVLYSPNFIRTPFHLFLVTLERGCEKKLHILWCMA